MCWMKWQKNLVGEKKCVGKYGVWMGDSRGDYGRHFILAYLSMV